MMQNELSKTNKKLKPNQRNEWLWLMSRPTPLQMPQWIYDHVIDCRRLLGISDTWAITVVLDDSLGGENSTDATCQPNYAYMDATIKLFPDIEEGEPAKELIMHEMCHILMCELDYFVYGALHQIKNKGKRGIFKRLYDDATERMIQTLVRGITKELRIAE